MITRQRLRVVLLILQIQNVKISNDTGGQYNLAPVALESFTWKSQLARVQPEEQANILTARRWILVLLHSTWPIQQNLTQKAEPGRWWLESGSNEIAE